MPSIDGVKTYVAKTYSQQKASRDRVEMLIRQLTLGLGGTIFQQQSEERRVFNILEELKKLTNFSEELGSMRRLLSSLGAKEKVLR